MCFLRSTILAPPSTMSQHNCDLPIFSHLDPQINLYKTWFIFLMQESGNIIHRLVVRQPRGLNLAGSLPIVIPIIV